MYLLMLWMDVLTLVLVLILSSLIVVGVALLSSCTSSTTLLVMDAGTYDAGISCAITTASSVDTEYYTILLLLLMHELLVLCICLLYTSPSPRDKRQSRMPSSA